MNDQNKLKVIIFLISILLLSTCHASPSSLPATPEPLTITETPLFVENLTAVPTSTIHPELQKLLYGVEMVLPAKAQPLFDRAWHCEAPHTYVSAVCLPYRISGGVSLMIIGQPRGQNGLWDVFEPPIRLWDWQDTGQVPSLWQEIRPLGDYTSSFLGRDSGNRWQAIISRLGADSSYEVLSFLPVADPDRFQVNRIALSSESESSQTTNHLIVRDGDRMLLYPMGNSKPSEIWSAKRTLPGYFRVKSPNLYQFDITGDDKQEVLVIWEEITPPVIDIYQVDHGGLEVLRWVGRVRDNWQFYDVTGDGLFDFLQPDNDESPQEWQIIRWDGNMFAADDKVSRPYPVGPPPVVISGLDDLPPLPSNLTYRTDRDTWWQWSWTGGRPGQVPAPPHSLLNPPSDYCQYRYGDACNSPAGRYKLVEVPGSVEGSSVAIFDGLDGYQSIIPDTFVYAVGHNTFSWSLDEKFLVMGQAEMTARVVRVNAVNGEAAIVWQADACGVDPTTCGNVSEFFGVTDPVVFDDGSIGFAVQSYTNSLYPPSGIYRITPENELILLAILPPMDLSKVQSMPNASFASFSGRLLWSPDRSFFLFHGSRLGGKNGVGAVILGRADGSAVWDMSELFTEVQEFVWE